MRISVLRSSAGLTPAVCLVLTAALSLPLASVFSQNSDTAAVTLDYCLARAYEQNPDILASGISVEESRERITEAKAALYPGLSFSVSGSRSSRESSGGAADQTGVSSGISASYPIFQGFKTIAGITAARANYEAATAQHHINRQDLVVTVTDAYYRLLQARRFVKVTEQSVKRARMHLDYSRALYENGLASRSDILKANVADSDARLARISARNAALAAQGKLNRYMGRDVQLPLHIIDDLETEAADSGSSAAMTEGQYERFLQLALAHRPELKKTGMQMEAQRAFIRIARSDYYPVISLDGNYRYTGETVSNLSSSSYIGMSLNVPLFRGFGRRSRLRQESLALRTMEQQQESIRQQISIEVWNAFLQVKESAERIVNSKIYYDNAVESRSVAEGEYRQGVGSMLDVIDAQTALVTAEQMLIEALADYKISQAALDRAVGTMNSKEMVL